MPTESIPIGPQYTLVQNVEYALPSVSCVVIQLSAAIETSLQLGGTYTATTSPVLTGGYVRCTMGNATITLRKNGVG